MHSIDKRVIIISRFHWKVATVWFEPVLRTDRPSISFIKAIHTPITQCVDYNNFLALNSNDDTEIIEVAADYAIFKKLLKDPNKMFDGIPITYTDIISNGEFPENYIFDLRNVKSMVIIGRFCPNVLPQPLKNIVNLAD